MKQPYVKYLGAFPDGKQMMSIYAVDASYIRRTYLGGIDFFAGHHEVFSWIPDSEIWLDSAMPIDEVEFDAGHELDEHYLMKVKHLPYGTAHKVANQHELKERTNFRPSIRFADE